MIGINWRVATPWIICAGLILFIVARPEEVIKVKVPAQSGSFRVTGPAPQKVQAPAPASIVEFNALEPSGKEIAYKEATSTRTYKKTFTDKVQTVTAEAVVIGTLESLELTYETEEQELEVPVRRRLNLYLGGEFTLQPPALYPSYSFKAYVASPKLMYSGGYDFQNKAVTLGLAFKAF